jgi:membrane protease YdiL (CAAX protease family)
LNLHRASPSLLRPGWKRWIGSLFALAVVLAALFVALRVTGTLGPRSLRWTLPLGFVLMMALPWIFLDRQGRERIGLVRSWSVNGYALALIAGAAMAGGCFAVGLGLFGQGQDNFFVSIANSYRAAMDTRGMDMLSLYLVFTIPALIFSPIGEEIFFRGFLQEALQERFRVRVATLLEAGLFGVVHLCHHGLVATTAGLVVLPVSGALWVLLMFAVALVFAGLRRMSGSLYPAMAAHMAFNATMNGLIFAWLWSDG